MRAPSPTNPLFREVRAGRPTSTSRTDSGGAYPRTVITRTDVEAAAVRIAGRVRRTPVAEVEPGRLWFKCEYLQHTGSFKARGALNRILASQQAGELDPGIGVVAASGGNAGLAVAYAAGQVGVPAHVYVPTTAPPVKVARLRALGAQVEQVGREDAEACEA